MLQGGLFEAFLRRWRKLSKQANHGYRRRSTPSGYCREEEEGVPEDVPRGHTVVYVGERRRRFVVRVALLEHPLFRALLEQAREEFGFGDGGKLRMPCDEALFLSALCHVSSRWRRGVWLCLWIASSFSSGRSRFPVSMQLRCQPSCTKLSAISTSPVSWERAKVRPEGPHLLQINIACSDSMFFEHLRSPFYAFRWIQELF